MASKIVIIFLRLFIFIGMMFSISSKNLNYQPTLKTSGFLSSDHQVLFQKIGFYVATVQYQHVVIPIPLWETLQELQTISKEFGDQLKAIITNKDIFTEVKTALITSARARIAKIVKNIEDIIDSLPTPVKTDDWRNLWGCRKTYGHIQFLGNQPTRKRGWRELQKNQHHH
jgi:hypothetical protein